MSTARIYSSGFLMAIGFICLLVGLAGDITAPGTSTINLGRLYSHLTASIWGFGLLIVGMLMRRPPR